MKKFSLLSLFCIFMGINVPLIAQPEMKREEIRMEFAVAACSCIDSISTFNKTRNKVVEEISQCIGKQTTTYQLMDKLMGAADMLKLDNIENKTAKEGENKKVNIVINVDESSQEYMNYYHDLERYLMENCPALKAKITSNDEIKRHSISSNPKARKYYQKGVDELKKENHNNAVKHFKKASKIDSKFAFAWDNLGLAYRKLGNYDKAIAAYQKIVGN